MKSILEAKQHMALALELPEEIYDFYTSWLKQNLEPIEIIMNIIRNTAAEDYEACLKENAHCEAAIVGWAQNLIEMHNDMISKIKK